LGTSESRAEITGKFLKRGAGEGSRRSVGLVVWKYEVFKHLAPELFFLNFSTPVYKIWNNTGTKYVRIMKQTAF